MKFGDFFINFGLILAIKNLRKHMILAVSIFLIERFRYIYIYNQQKKKACDVTELAIIHNRV
jgi:hypothetical protein